MIYICYRYRYNIIFKIKSVSMGIFITSNKNECKYEKLKSTSYLFIDK